jgi:hypothetical protein
MKFRDFGSKNSTTYYVIVKNGQPLVRHRDEGKVMDLIKGLRQQFPKDKFEIRRGQGWVTEDQYRCAECGGAAMENPGELEEAKKDACYYKVRSRYKVWPSAYASGALVQCRKKGASNWGTKAQKESLSTAADAIDEQSDMDALKQDDAVRVNFWVKDKGGNYHGPYRSDSVARASVPFRDRPGGEIIRLPARVRNPRTLDPSNTRSANARIAGGAIKEAGQADALGISDPNSRFHPMNIQMLVGAFLRTHRMTDGQDLQDNLDKHIGQWLSQHEQQLDQLGYQVSDFHRLMALMQEVMDVDAVFEGENLEENLRKWFKEKWVRFGPDGKIRGDCARGSDSEGKPKCLPQSKAHSLGKKGRASAAARKRRQDPNADRSGRAINVNTKKKSNKGVAEATAVTDYDPKSRGGTRKELLAKYHKTKNPKDAEAARKAGATQKELQGVREEAKPLDPRPTMAPRHIEYILTVDGTETAVYDSLQDAINDARRFALRYPDYDIVIKRDVCTRTNLMRVQEGMSLGALP